MALNEQYFVTGDLTTYFVDKDSGLPNAGGFINFYRDVARNTPKTVYQLTGAPPNYEYVALPNPVELSSVGTPQDAVADPVIIYYYPYDDEGNLDLYYIVVTDSNGVVQETIEAWPNLTAGDTPGQNDFSIANQLSNSQFTQTFVPQEQAIVYEVSSATNQVFFFAPNWDFVISGTGSVTVQQVAIAGNVEVPTSPPYVLDISLSSGITACFLRQRLNANSGLWASTANVSIYLSGTLVAINQNAGTTGIEMFYNESTGGSPIPIVDASFDNSGYQVITGVTEDPIPLSTNTDTGFEGYVDIYLSFSIGSHVRISSIQVVPTLNQAGGALIPYELNSSNREQAFMGDYFIPRLNSRPTPSLLIAWDFPLNPFQFLQSGNITTTAAYICDQTIALCGSSGDVAFARDSVTNGLALTTAGSNDAFYIMQYLSGSEAKKLLGTSLSVNVFGYMTSASSDVTMQVYLFRAPSTAAIPTLPTSIGTLNSSGDFALTATGWTQIPQNGLISTAILPAITADSGINNFANDIGFTGWEITDSTQISDTEYFAIVVTFAYIDTDTAITINSISLTPGDIPCRPAPEPTSQVLAKCQYYYEKSCDLTQDPLLTANNGARMEEMVPILSGSLVYGAKPLSFAVLYETRKRTPISGFPVIPQIYSTDGTLNSVFVEVYLSGTLENSGDAAISNWSATISGQTNVLFLPVNQSTPILGSAGNVVSTNAEAFILYQFVADARLGIV